MIGFNTKLQQTQSLSPKMIQSVKILQIATSELENYINELALENPVIDVMDSAKKSESIEQQLWTRSIDEESSYLSQRQNNDDDHAPKDTFYSQDSQHETLRDYLWSQLMAESFSSQEKTLQRPDSL